MNIFKKLVLFFRKKFKKTDNVKKLEAPKPIINNEKNEFINSLKVHNTNNPNKRVETLICIGDGLGFQDLKS